MVNQLKASIKITRIQQLTPKSFNRCTVAEYFNSYLNKQLLFNTIKIVHDRQNILVAYRLDWLE